MFKKKKKREKKALFLGIHPSDVWVLAIVDTKEGCQLQQQRCAYWGISMNSCYKANLGLGWFRFLWFVGDFQSQNGPILYTLAQT